ncbi:synaptobrevin-related protein [Vairimorpha apis BRL 01]|uniref:Synaptobrevin-related protein n=1 Tax=Vairimorpha apis BRL 01 TaxID=1037528 RepID=T0LAB5_9MICR|nr:synaptobrevin-related protein [Vairimorpha apis BRL 01]
MSDEVTKKIESEIGGLKGKLQDRLKETEDINDLESGLEKQTFKLKKTTEEHQTISRDTKMKMWWKYAKWVAIGCIIIGLLGWIVLKPLYKTIRNF